MKTKILVLALVAATIVAVLAYPSIRAATARGVPIVAPIVAPIVTPIVAPPVQPPRSAHRVEVVFVLDTTGSMSGLIAAAKEKIWSIASTLTQAQQAPQIAMGLVAYRDRGDEYVTRIVDLSTDLDTMYATLMGFAAGGGGDGPESVNRALEDAVHAMSWSNDPNTYRVVFLVGDAPPHMDYYGETQYPAIVAEASRRGIVINTIQCGSMMETVASWQHIAALGQGRYFTVAQAGSAVAIATPFDTQIAELARRLDGTRMYYGSGERRLGMEAKVRATEEMYRSASSSAQARRGVFNSAPGGATNMIGEGELVADFTSGTVDLDAVPKAELPASLQALSSEDARKVLADTAAERSRLQAEINELGAKRDRFIADEIAANGGAAGSLDREIYETVKVQGARFHLDYERGPSF